MFKDNIFDHITTVYLNGEVFQPDDIEELQYGSDIDAIKVDVFNKQHTFSEFLEFADEVERSSLDTDVIAAYISNTGCDLGNAVSEAEEAFAGEFSNDRDFAQDMADQLGMEKDLSWPHNCIDWEMAAKELMYDYFEQDGYYFRNM